MGIYLATVATCIHCRSKVCTDRNDVQRELNMNDERAANAVDRRLGQRVRTRRLEIGMSQERLAELLGVTFQQVQKYEKGVNRIAASRLVDICAALDFSIAQLFAGIAPTGRAPD